MAYDSVNLIENGVGEYESGSAGLVCGIPTPLTQLERVKIDDNPSSFPSVAVHGVEVEETQTSTPHAPLQSVEVETQPSTPSVSAHEENVPGSILSLDLNYDLSKNAVADLPEAMSIDADSTSAAGDSISKDFAALGYFPSSMSSISTTEDFSGGLFVTPAPTSSTVTPPTPPTTIPAPVKNEEPEDEEEDQWMFGGGLDDTGEDNIDLKPKKATKDGIKGHEDSPNLVANYDEPVVVYVGPKGEEFEVHQNLLCHMSGYFFQYFKYGGAVPVREAVLLKSNVEFFSIFHRFCYSGQIVLPKAPTKARQPTQYLLGAYYLADLLAAQRFKNAIVDQLSRELLKKGTPSDKFAKWAKGLYSKVKADPIRRLFKNAFFLRHRSQIHAFNGNASHADFKDAALKLAFGPAKEKPKHKELNMNTPGYCAEYHEHDHFNPAWVCHAERHANDPFFNKPAKSGRGKGPVSDPLAKAKKLEQEEEKFDADFRKASKKRKIQGGGIDPDYVPEDEDDD